MKNQKFPCKKTLICKRCGTCCHIRESESIKLTPEEDLSIRKRVYENTGVIYIFPLKRYTISITKEEKQELESEAKKLKIKLKILPKKIIINTTKTKAEIIDYFIDHGICPFLKNKNFCLIYSLRPQVCRIFPHIMKQDIINQSILADKHSNFSHTLKKAKTLIQKV